MRVLTNLENLNAEMKSIDDQTPMPELQHNVKFILDKVKESINNFNNQNWRHESEGGAALERNCTTKTKTRQHKGYYGTCH